MDRRSDDSGCVWICTTDDFESTKRSQDFIGGCTCDNVGQQQVVQFDVARREAFFLFAGDTDLLNYLADIRQKAADLALAKSQAIEQAHPGSPASKERDAIRDWFQVQLNAVNDRFAPHLSFAYPVQESVNG